MSKYVIIGSGISGCTAAYELAQQGHHVELLESSNVLGGAIIGYACKATDECSRCGVCVAHTRLYEALTHNAVNVSTGVSIQSVTNNGTIQLNIARKNPNISYHSCIACDQCVHVCPEHCITKIQRAEFTQYVIDFDRCLLHQGSPCTACSDACTVNAISAQTAITETAISGDAALIATGHTPYEASRKVRFGYGRLKNVLTGVEAEEILSKQTSLRNPGDSIAFIQCVGSRDPGIGRNYCSSVCCAYALRLARMIKHRQPETEVTVYYIDIQHFDKTFSLFRKSVEESGVRFVRGLPFLIEQATSGRVKLSIENQNGAPSLVEHDLVVLSVGMGPAPDADNVASVFDLQCDEFGFFSSQSPQMFVSGTCREPLSISDSMTTARAVAFEMLHTARDEQPSIQPEKAAAREAVNALSERAFFEKKNVPLEQKVLVIGCGIAGTYVAEEIHRFGYATTVIEQTERLCGQVSSDALLRLQHATASAGKLLGSVMQGIKGIQVLTGSSLTELTGHLGNFSARITTPNGERILQYGAVVMASGSCANMPDVLQHARHIVSITDINLALSELEKKRGVRSIGLILDMELDEDKASMDIAFNLALHIQGMKRYQVYLFCRDVRVAARGLELLYDDVREAGVTIVKYDGKLSLQETGEGVVITYHDGILRQEMTVSCDRVGVSPFGVAIATDTKIAGITQLSTDAYGQLQDNNIHLFPEHTNRPGIFVVGSCRGQHYVPRILAEAKATALEVHALLSQQSLEVELSNALVDEDKCVLCLTCIRSCPHKAMQVNREKGAAESIPEACQKCGICAGECPAKAIKLPLYSDEFVLSQVNA